MRRRACRKARKLPSFPVIRRNQTGPFTLKYVNAEDDPGKR